MQLVEMCPVHRILATEFHKLPAFHPLAGEYCPVYCYLIEHPDGPILVDTGAGTGHEVIDKLYRPANRSLRSALADHRIDVSEVVAVINSHLHFDHCGRNSDFSKSSFYIQRAEYEAAQGPNYTVREWFDLPGAELRVIEGEHEVARGVRIIPTPGHTPGHQSVLIEAENGRCVIIAQAAYDSQEFVMGGDASSAMAGLEESYLASIARVKALDPVEVCFSHDEKTWRAQDRAQTVAR